MNGLPRWAAPAVLLLAAAAARASDPVGVYAAIDRLVFDPSDSAPERVQVWGTFAVAKGNGDTYDAPVYGCLSYRLDKDKAEQCRKEWNDLNKVAGTGKCVGFGGRYQPNGKVQKPGAKLGEPEKYPLGIGVIKVEASNPTARDLRAFPQPQAPAEGDEVAAGTIALRARAWPAEGSKTTYVFAIEDSAGKTETSSPLEATDGTLKWSPQLSLKAGEKYTWRVWMDTKKSDTTTASTFRVKAAP